MLTDHMISSRVYTYVLNLQASTWIAWYIRTTVRYRVFLRTKGNRSQSGSGFSQKFFGDFVRIRRLIWDPKGLGTC
jgi:hypothetical protein